jgi:response regulator NasT
MTRRDRDALDGIRQVAALDTGPVLPFVDQDEPAFVEDAIGAQVSFYNAMGLRPPDVQPVLCAAVALFRRHQQMQEDLKQAESRLNESAVVDRAKVTPIKQRWLSEPDTCRWLPRALMSSARRTVDVATELIKALEGNAG